MLIRKGHHESHTVSNGSCMAVGDIGLILCLSHVMLHALALCLLAELTADSDKSLPPSLPVLWKRQPELHPSAAKAVFVH